jgi:NTE family protein
MNDMPEHEAFANVDVTGSLNGSAHSSDAFGAGLERIFLPGGQILFRENEVADSLYIVISGCLGVVIRRKVARLLEQNFGGLRIEELWRPFFCVSTNLTTGTLAVHRDGVLVDALQASICIPGLLPPVIMGGDVHVDGGVMNWLPVDVPGAKRGTIIAVDVASDPALVSFEECNRAHAWRFLGRRRKFPPIVAVLLRAATVSGDSLTKTAHGQVDILFKPPLENVDLLDWQACDQAIETGYRHAVEKLEQLGKPVASCIRGLQRQ